MEQSQFRTVLADAGYSVTKPRQAVFSTLEHADEPLKTGEVVKRTSGIDRASVYRTLELFATLGITSTTIRGWTPFTELTDPFKPHHHHLICERCGTVEEIESETLEDVLSLIASKHHFTLTRHTVELTGYCSECQKLITHQAGQ